MGLFNFLFNNELQNVSELGTDEIEAKYKNFKSKEYQKELQASYEYFCNDTESD